MGGSGKNQPTQLFEIAIGVIAVKKVRNLQAQAFGAQQRARRNKRTCVVLYAINSICIRRQRPYTGLVLQGLH